MFEFKSFRVDDSRCSMKVGTDGVLLGAWVDVNGATKVLDAGCGSGLIALMIAQRNPKAAIDAVDIDSSACDQAKENVNSSAWVDRINVINRDIAHDFMSEGYDLIVSNPPFFKENVLSSDNGRVSARHESDFGVEWLIKNASRLLNNDGKLSFICPSSRDGEIEFLVEMARLSISRRCAVVSVKGKEAFRTLWQLSVNKVPYTECTTLVIRGADQKFTEQYIELTSDFYLYL